MSFELMVDVMEASIACKEKAILLHIADCGGGRIGYEFGDPKPPEYIAGRVGLTSAEVQHVLLLCFRYGVFQPNKYGWTMDITLASRLFPAPAVGPLPFKGNIKVYNDA